MDANYEIRFITIATLFLRLLVATKSNETHFPSISMETLRTIREIEQFDNATGIRLHKTLIK